MKQRGPAGAAPRREVARTQMAAAHRVSSNTCRETGYTPVFAGLPHWCPAAWFKRIEGSGQRPDVLPVIDPTGKDMR